MDHDRGVGSLDDGGAPDLVADGELIAVIDGGLAGRRPLDGARLADGGPGDDFARGLAAPEGRPRRERARPQPADDELELRAGERRAAAVQLLVARDEELAQRGLVLRRQAIPGKQDLHLIDLAAVAHVEGELE